MKKMHFSFYIALSVLWSSCSSYKKIPYFNDLDQTKSHNEDVKNTPLFLIRAADILTINVTSRNPETSIIFNNNISANNTSSEISSSGYLVDDKGNINLPYLGTIKAEGLTTSQLRDSLSIRLRVLYKDPIVNVRLVNFRVAVYGDVLRPNVYTLQNERTTITQVLSLAGDLNITAKRTNILLIRHDEGERKFIRIDLTSKKIFDSPYYYLQNNDEIYVQPDRTKFASVDRGYRTTSLILSALSIIAIVISNVYR